MSSRLATGATLESRLAAAVDEFMTACRDGERPDVEAFVQHYPELADHLRQVLPALALLEPSALASDEPASLTGTLGDFRLIREVGRGGMGIVYEAEQISLGRRVALKVLPLAATMDAKQLQRFRNEAKAAASLHHEHIVPVYAVGCERGMHYYAMQFVEGQTLAQMIPALHVPPAAAAGDVAGPYPPAAADAPTAPRAAPSTERSSPKGRDFYRTLAQLAVQAADALEHAHSVGIVHRDVKPGNFMVDASGKLWVTDFGLARFGPDAGLTISGDLLGTLRYMAPEQVLARHGLVDHRADVYGLGATLYELLTCRPAVDATERAEMLRQIAFEEPVAPCKLDRAIPAELETITLKCLVKNPAERYATAGDLADDLRRWLEHKTIKAKPPSLRQKVTKWARRHAATVGASAAALLVVLTMAGAMAGWWLKDRAVRRTETARSVRAALEEAEQLQAARKTPEALAKVRAAAAVLAAGVATSDLERTVNAQLRDLNLAAELLEEIRIARTAIPFSKQDRAARSAAADKQFAQLQAYGVDVDALTVEQAGQRIRAGTVAVEIAAALDDWSAVVNDLQPLDPARRNRLLAIARLADPDPLRCRLRQILEEGDAQALKGLLPTEGVSALPPATVVTLATFLGTRGSLSEGVELLRQAQLRHPTDFWINLVLGTMLHNKEFPRVSVPVPVVRESPKNHDIIRFFSIACALRPESPAAHVSLGYALIRTGQFQEAEASLQEALRLKPNDESALFELGHLQKSPDYKVAQFRKVLRINPNNVNAQINVCLALEAQGRLDEAIAEYREAIRRIPGASVFYNNLGLILKKNGQLEEAIASYQQAIGLAPNDAKPRANLGLALAAKGQWDEAIAVYREGLRLNPKSVELSYFMAWMLATCPDPRLRDPQEALERARKAVELMPGNAHIWYTLGVANYRNGEWNAAIEALTKSIELAKEENAAFNFFFLAMAHERLGDKKQAREWYDRAVAWMDQRMPKDEDLLRFRAEAAALLGVPEGPPPQGGLPSPPKD